MGKTPRLFLTIMLLACLTFPLSACGRQAEDPEPEDEAAVERAGLTTADLLGTVWHTAGGDDPKDFGFYLEFPSEEQFYLMWVYFGGIDGVQGFEYTVQDHAILQDGRQTGVIADDLSEIELAFPDGTTHTFVPDERELTSLEGFENMTSYLDPIFAEDGSRVETYEAHATASTTPKEEPVYEDQVITTTVGIKVTMPGKWAAKGLAWMVDERFQLMRLEYALDGNRVQIAEIDWDERATLPYEADDEVWELGNVVDSGVVHQAALHIMYVDADGKTYSANISVSGARLASEYFLGLSADEILSWITIADDGGAQSSATEGLSTRTGEFCGVWAYASKDLGDAVWFAGDARQRGFAAEVFLTTDWSNLNSEPWYVVSLGCAYSEEEANRVLQSAHNSVYGDAYIKWSGDYIG